MSGKKRRRIKAGAIFTFAIIWAVWAVLTFVFPQFKTWGLILALLLSSLTAFIVGRSSAKKDIEAESAGEKQDEAVPKKSYGPEIDPIVEEGNKALSEMGRLYTAINDADVRKKINEIMRITDKIMQDAIHDPSDIPQIKKFFSYYLPTTIKLLNTYDRMGAQGIEGENLDKSMKNINAMLDSAIIAYKKRLDSLFADQALDIETDIEVMNTMIAREGLSCSKDFDID